MGREGLEGLEKREMDKEGLAKGVGGGSGVKTNGWEMVKCGVDDNGCGDRVGGALRERKKEKTPYRSSRRGINRLSSM